MSGMGGLKVSMHSCAGQSLTWPARNGSWGLWLHIAANCCSPTGQHAARIRFDAEVGCSSRELLRQSIQLVPPVVGVKFVRCRGTCQGDWLLSNQDLQAWNPPQPQHSQVTMSSKVCSVENIRH